MAYTNPTPLTTDHIVTAAEWNTDLVDNLQALKDPPTAHYELNEAADLTTTSTAWADVSTTKLTLSVTTTGGDLLVGFCGVVHKATDGRVYFDLQVDGVGGVAGDDGFIALEQATGRGPLSFTYLVTGLAAGAHTLALRWKITGTGAATIYAGAGTANLDLHPQFWAREVS